MTSETPNSDATGPAERFPFRRDQHLRKPAEFERVYNARQRAADGRLLVYAARNDLGWTRIGLSVSRRHGGSVQRQRIKRRLREAFRLSQHDLPSGMDVILIPKSLSSVIEYRRSMLQLLRKVERRQPRSGTQSPDAAAASGDPLQ